MNIDIIFKIASVGIIVAVTNQILNKNGREDMATMVTIVGIIVVLFTVVGMISEFFSTVKTMFNAF